MAHSRLPQVADPAPPLNDLIKNVGHLPFRVHAALHRRRDVPQAYNVLNNRTIALRQQVGMRHQKPRSGIALCHWSVLCCTCMPWLVDDIRALHLPPSKAVMATGGLSVLSPWHKSSGCSRLKSSCERLPDLALRHASRKTLESSESKAKAKLYADWYDAAAQRVRQEYRGRLQMRCQNSGVSRAADCMHRWMHDLLFL